MLIEIARSLNNLLKTIDNNWGVKFIFFDGEEAFISWTSTDSIYGARHLAEVMEKNNEIQKIELFVLLDLIGYKNPKFHNVIFNSESYFDHLINIEMRLRDLVLLNSKEIYFVKNQYGSRDVIIGDDHIPFLKKGVKVIHMIPPLFPVVWHQPTDTPDNLDYTTIFDLINILKVFIVELLSLN